MQQQIWVIKALLIFFLALTLFSLFFASVAAGLQPPDRRPRVWEPPDRPLPSPLRGVCLPFCPVGE
jgi:hypothetical protein